ncbi:MAG TPA: hypothetical protein VJP79_08460, partial [Nitrososphaera sp.]|nr:hypothetical protein [Nitrososphaera sp.]
GGFVIFNFKLSDYIRYDRPFNLESDVTNPFSEQVRSKVPSDSREFVNNLAFLAEPLSAGWIKDKIENPSDDIIVNWSNLVSHIGRLKPHQELRSVFTKLLQFTNITENVHIASEDLSPDLHGFKVRAASTYRIILVQRYLNHEVVRPTFKIELATDSKDIALTKGQGLVQGSYDVLEYIISIPNVISGRESFLHLRPDETGDKSFMVSSTIHFVKISPNPKKIAGIVTIVISGIALAGISTMVADWTKIPQLANVLSIAGAIISAVFAPFFPKD